MTHTISAAVADVFKFPDTKSEHIDEALYGTAVDITDRLNGFVRIKDQYGYSGWVLEECVSIPLADPNFVVTLPFADLLPEANNFYKPVMTLPMGARVDVGFSDEFERHAFVVLPNKRIYYIRKEAISPIIKEKSEAKTRDTIVQTASSFLGVQYRWGGKTYNGIDCSGLAFMSCNMAGIDIWRDADIDKTPRFKKIDKENAKPGDFYFFNGHIAVAIGDGDFIHASSGAGKVTYGTFEQKSGFYSKWFDDNLVAVGTLF